MKAMYTGVLLSFIAIFISCCKKPNAGLGGSSSLKITAAHHGTTIDSFVVKVKFNAQDAPSNNVYDIEDSTSSITVPIKNQVVFSGLKTGEYYLFCKGWDASIAQYVSGGMPFTISKNSTTETLVIAVSE